MKNDNLPLAKQSLTLILERLKISFVIFVDDNFEKKPKVEIVIGWINATIENLPNAIIEKYDDVDFNNLNLWQQQFADLWGNLDDNEKKSNAVFISQTLGKSLPHEEMADDALSLLFNNKAQFLSPPEWDAQKEEILKKISQEKKALCFFDQDLSLSEGYTSEGSKSGIGLIKATKAQWGELAICCLLSQTIQEIENETDVWRQMASDDLPLSDFLPIAKKRLGNDSAFVFLDGIKKATLNSYFEHLKLVTAEIVKISNEKALDDFSKLDPYDFDVMVLKSSEKEGIWESEALLRIYQIFHKDEVFKVVTSPETLSKISKTVDVARKISKVKLDDSIVYKYPQVRPTRKKEMFMSASVLFYTPLETGDIFEISGTDEKFILLGQPCDLMIRSDGRRSNANYTAPLVSIERRSLDDVKSKDRSFWRTHYILDHYFEKVDEIATISFSNSFSVSTDLLDLCVMDSDGHCKLDTRTATDTPLHLTNGWQKRIRKLADTFKDFSKSLNQVRTELEKVEDQAIRERLWISAMPKLYIGNLGLPETPFNNDVFNFNLQRVARLRAPHTERLLKAFTDYLSRDADDVDFVKFSE